MATATDRELSIRTDDGVTLSGTLSAATPSAALASDQPGSGQLADAEPPDTRPAVVLLHGLTATRRYVVMGSRLLERAGLRVFAYDARGHGRSSAAPNPQAYDYESLTSDLRAVLDQLEIERAILAGASMGAHTALAFALGHPERVAALGIVTPAFDPDKGPAQAPGTAAGTNPGAKPGTAQGADTGTTQVADMDTGEDPLANGLREGGVEGFVRAYDFSSVPEAWRETVEKVIRQRLGAHEHPAAVADALEVVPRSRPFAAMGELAGLGVPTVVVASRDEVDPGHPLALADRYARAIPGAQLKVEDGGPPVRSPIAWQGGQLSKVLIDLAERVS
jgi:pimeloyl-ACP methyl ester carboxylesterase